MAGVVGLVVGVSIFDSLLPAIRAARVNPMRVLRTSERRSRAPELTAPNAAAVP